MALGARVLGFGVRSEDSPVGPLGSLHVSCPARPSHTRATGCGCSGPSSRCTPGPPGPAQGPRLFPRAGRCSPPRGRVGPPQSELPLAPAHLHVGLGRTCTPTCLEGQSGFSSLSWFSLGSLVSVSRAVPTGSLKRDVDPLYRTGALPTLQGPCCLCELPLLLYMLTTPPHPRRLSLTKPKPASPYSLAW